MDLWPQPQYIWYICGTCMQAWHLSRDALQYPITLRLWPCTAAVVVCQSPYNYSIHANYIKQGYRKSNSCSRTTSMQPLTSNHRLHKEKSQAANSPALESETCVRTVHVCTVAIPTGECPTIRHKHTYHPVSSFPATYILIVACVWTPCALK